MELRNDYQLITDALKSLLKRKKVNYKQLAAKLKMSESGVKKALTAKDGTFSRIHSICEAIGVSLKDLLAQVDSKEVHPVFFSTEQQEYFLKNMTCFYFYWLLVYERQTLEAATAKLKLSKPEYTRYLRQLDQMNLVRWETGDRVKVPRVEVIEWMGGGPLIEKIFKEWSAQTLRTLAKPVNKRQSNELFIIRYFQMQDSTFKKLLDAQKQLELDFTRLAVQEMKLSLPKMKPVRWIAAIDDRSFLDSE